MAQADDQEVKFSALPPGTLVIAQDAIERSKVECEFGSVAPVVTTDRSFTKAARIRTVKRPATPYQFQLRVPITGAVHQGDRLLAVFEARAVEVQEQDGLAESELVFEAASAPYTKSISHHIEFGIAWQRFYIPFEAKLDHEPGQAAVILRGGYAPQTIEIGGVQVLNFQRQVPLDQLPSATTTYLGREADSPWRQLAAERIDRLRKADLTIKVVDAAGKPIPGAKVLARMKRSAFAWGTAVDARMLFESGPDGERYRQTLTANFNTAVLENHMKWPLWQANRQPAIDAVAWLHKQGLAVRGHVLVWPGKKNLPEPVANLLLQPDALRRAILDHIAEEAGAFRGQLVEWDVVNEPYTNFDVQTALTGVSREGSPDYIERHAAVLAPFFTAAHTADPAVKLDLNDYSILESGGKDAAHQEHYERTIRALRAEGAPLQGIGIQGHFDENLTPIPRLWQILDRFGKLGLPIQITEFDVNVWDEALQADYTRDFLTAMFAHENIRGVLVWGFWEKRHWIPNAALYRSDWTLRPAGQVWLDLVQKQWRTDAEGITDASGQWEVRGFHGEYKITVVSDERTSTALTNLPPDGATVTITPAASRR